MNPKLIKFNNRHARRKWRKALNLRNEQHQTTIHSHKRSVQDELHDSSSQEHLTIPLKRSSRDVDAFVESDMINHLQMNQNSKQRDKSPAHVLQLSYMCQKQLAKCNSDFDINTDKSRETPVHVYFILSCASEVGSPTNRKGSYKTQGHG